MVTFKNEVGSFAQALAGFFDCGLLDVYTRKFFHIADEPVVVPFIDGGESGGHQCSFLNVSLAFR